jgi:hypothetical protein
LISQPIHPSYATFLSGDHKILRRNPDNLLLKNNGFKKHPASSCKQLYSKNLLYPKDTVFSFI